MLEILCCPLCKVALKLQIETKSNENIIRGSIDCSNCKNKYLIYDGIPRMYIPGNEFISFSKSSKFSKFIITPENLDKWIKSSENRKSSSFFTNNKLTKFLVGFGWTSLFFCIALLILYYLSLNVVTNNKIPIFFIYMLMCISGTFFVIDYLRYRIEAKINYKIGIYTLKELSDKQKLNEFDIRSSIKDREESFKVDFESQEDFVDSKGKRIVSILNNYNFRGKNALNVGCGGALHKSVSKPYFDKGYNMIGVDISEEYLRQFNQIFNTDVVQANSLALPFRSNNFDLINFTDIIEHLHNPVLGLSEAQRVLKRGGVIILTTNNHCTFSRRCINPLVFVEKVISLYYDSILPPRNILGQWMDFNFYHTEFSKNEITKLIKAAGFEILSFETQFPNKDKLNKIFKKLHALRFMGSEFMIIGKKKQSYRKNILVEIVDFG